LRTGFLAALFFSLVLIWQSYDLSPASEPRRIRLIAPKPMLDLESEKLFAIQKLNRIREATGLPPFALNSTLSKAAQAHADYLVIHHTSSHNEQPSKKGFSGKSPMERAARAGYGAKFVGENLSTKNHDAENSVDGLLSAIYHRFGFLNPLFDEIGAGIAQEKKDPDNSAFVYLMGNSEIEKLCKDRSFSGKGSYVYKVCRNPGHRIEARAYRRAKMIVRSLSPDIIKYPYDNQQNVPPAFYDETPDPLPGYDVSGFPISIEFNHAQKCRIKLLSFKLYKKQQELRDVLLLDKGSDPHHKLSRCQYALLPLKRLDYDTLYTVKVKYLKKGKLRTLKWSFRTLVPSARLITIRNPKADMVLEAGKSYWLYFEPQNPHDLLGTMQFPSDISVNFPDNNTMQINIPAQKTGDFEIKGSGREIKIKIR